MLLNGHFSFSYLTSNPSSLEFQELSHSNYGFRIHLILFFEHLAISLTPTHPALQQRQESLPSRYAPSQGPDIPPTPHMTFSSHQLIPHTHPPTSCSHWSPVHSSRAPLLLSSARNTRPSPHPPVNLGTPTPAGRLFPNVSSSVESSPPLPGVRMSLKAFSHPWCNTSHLCTGSNWSCCSPLPSKDLGDFQGQTQCLISFQSPNGNLMLYNVFLLSYLIAVLLIHVPEGRGSGFFTALVLVLITVPDSW